MRIFGLNPLKKSQAITFRFERLYTKHLGYIYRPVADVQFWSAEFQEWQKYTMLVDTGADYTILPLYMAGLLGLNLEKANSIDTHGIEGKRSTYFLENLSVNLGPYTRQVPVGIANTSKIPPILGRHLFLETFETTFKGRENVTFSDAQE